jgi:hypothetical protein
MKKPIDLTMAREMLHDFQEVCKRCDPGEVAGLDDDVNAVRAQNRMLIRWLNLYAHAVMSREM